jgi:MoaA/NifB/PqqE/SkfB family radical SAM enzyme
MRSYDDGVVRLGPQTVHLDITNACNTDCVTCWDHSPHLRAPPSSAWKRRRADPARLAALLDDIMSLGGLEAVIVSGMGEPFTHPAVYEVLADIKRRGLHLTVITNLIAAEVERVIEIGVDSLLIGVQGASEASYLAFHPSFHAGHWARLQAALAALRAAGRRDKHVQVICDVNAHELVAMVEQADRFAAAQINFKLASLRAGTEAVRIDEARRAALLAREVPAAARRAEELGVAHNLEVFAQQLRAGGEATAPIAGVGCFLGYHYSRVTVDGTVLYCCNTEVEVGTLATAEFSALWRGEQWARLRARLRDGRYFAGCAQCGKFNQNVKLSRRFRRDFGEARWLEVTGRGPGAAPRVDPVRLRVLP